MFKVCIHTWSKVKSDLLNNIDMLLMGKKGIKGGIYRCIYTYAIANKL